MLSTATGRGGCPAAAATEQASARTASTVSRPPGTAITVPIGPPSRTVAAPPAAMKIHFSHMSCVIVEETTVRNAAG